ncbi:MAG TPA: ATP-binding protein [Vicinamibacterales bacterium]|nr:ATP-binding protein [Vicinamibacterales bacterium]
MRALTDTQKQLQQTRAHYVELFDFAPVTYALLDSVGLILNVSLAGCRLLNIQRSHLIGHPLLSFVVQEDRREMLEHLRRCRTGTGVVESEIRFSSRDGRRVTCRLHSRAASYDGRDLVPTLIVDQTEHLALDEARLAAERRREQAERDAQAAMAANALKDRLIATVSHELRTPLTPALFAASHLAAADGLSGDVRTLAATIKRNIEFEARLIDDLLDVACINRNALELRLETVDVHMVIDEAVETCRADARQGDVAIQTHLTAPAHHVRGDRVRLRQVFWNLLNNAVKFTGPGGRIIVASSNGSDTALRVTIRDEGVGMEPVVLESLFAPFEHRPVQPESRTGLGLGLSICKGIVALHGGQIWASSEGPGRGSTFGVELNTTVGPEAQTAAEGAPDTAREASTGRRVLIVEDDADSGHLLSLFLSTQGYEVEVASSLAEALSKLDRPWDVVISDIGLSDGSGLEVARRAVRLPRPPERLIALTGYGTSDDLEATREAGFHDHVVKPIDPHKLLRTIGDPAKIPT